tara:strand:- start:953 stop:1180 length:228 start_codon:yes stop_codon:yes gene_type:complete
MAPQKITCRTQVLGKSFKGKVSKSQRKQINNCKVEKLKNKGKGILNKVKNFKPVITTKGGDTISLRTPIIRKQNK